MSDKIFNDDTLAQIVQVQAIEISQLQSILSLSTEREERYRKALDGIAFDLDCLLNNNGHETERQRENISIVCSRNERMMVAIFNVARTALDEGKENS